jgi:osmotically inducible protein OsmC
MKRFGSAAWSGSLRNGKGTVATESHALDSYPYTYFSRYGEKPGTNPEELLGTAHGACFAMSFVRMLEMSHFEPEQLDARSEVVIDRDADGFTITSVHLSVAAKIPGIDDATFQSIAMEAKSGCPISKLVNTNISFDARLATLESITVADQLKLLREKKK